MREIKFRAWDGKELSYFNLSQIAQDESYRVYYNGQKEIDITIIEQYTGLKDKNEKEIYEGDILRDNKGDDGIVKYNQNTAAFVAYVGNEIFNLNENDSNRKCILQYTEIIGNIHENPEILKEN